MYRQKTERIFYLEKNERRKDENGRTYIYIYIYIGSGSKAFVWGGGRGVFNKRYVIYVPREENPGVRVA